MLLNIKTVYFLIWAICIGIAAAIIYTNLSRSALSTFINALTDRKIFSQECAKTLNELGLSPQQSFIIKGAVKNQYGLRRIIGSVKKCAGENEELKKLLGESIEESYYLLETDTEEILKKYTYKTMKARFVFLFIIAMIILAFLTTQFAEIFHNYVMIPKMQETEQADKGKPVDNSDVSLDKEDVEEVEDQEDTDTDNNDSNDDNVSEAPLTPQIPTIPTAPTIPTIPTLPQ